MAEITKKTTHRKAKGTRTDGKPGRSKCRRPSAAATHTRQREKTPPAQAAKKPATACRGKQRAAERKPEPVSGEDMLQDEVDLQLRTRSKELAQAMMNHAIAGKSGYVKALFGHSKKHDPVVADSPSPHFTAYVQEMAGETECEDLAEPTGEVSQPAEHVGSLEPARLGA
jgi:hypothetical protein